jgi:hypothetical protein
MKQAMLGLAIAIGWCAAGPVMAQAFPPKPETIKQIILGTVGEVVVPRRDPRARTTTITSASSNRGSSLSTSDTFDNTPERPEQILRIINNSIYDLKDISVGCFYVAETGAPVENLRSHTFLLVFPASSRRNVSFSEIRPLRYARGLACSVTDFEYIGMGVPPTPEPEIRREIVPSNPVVNEWALGRKLY